MKKIGLRAKLLLFILPVVLGGLVAGGLVNYLVSSSNIEQQQIINTTLVVEQLDRSLTLWLSNREREAVLLGGQYVIQQSCLGKMIDIAQQRIAYLHKISPGYETVWLADPQGRIFLDSIGGQVVGLEVGKLPNYRANIEQSAKGETHLSGVGQSPSSGRPVVLLTVPVKADGQVVGIIGLAFELNLLWDDFLSQIKIGQKGYAWMTDGNGLMLAHPNKDLIFNLKLEDQDFGREILSRKNGHYFYEWEGLNKIAFFRSNQFSGWITVISPVPEEYMAPVQEVKYWAWLVGLVTGILVFGIVWWVIGRVVKAIYSLKSSLETMALGDLSQRVVTGRNDEIGQLARSLNLMADSLEKKVDLADQIAAGDISKNVQLISQKDHLGLALQTMVQGLNQIVSSIKDSVSIVASGSTQIAEASQAQSKGATEQAASLEEITSSMGELGSKTRSNAEIASRANLLSASARESAHKGNEQMGEMVTAMTEITGSSKEIAKIIKTIDDIAFQTNLLALNAAVEAARAGKHGQGFAVVAHEVRNLAGRSARAARETAELIDGSLKKVENGMEIVNRTAGSLLQIVDSTSKMTELISEIASSSKEQAAGIAQINLGLAQIEKVTHQYTANAEETAAASEELSDQAVQLRELVARFKINGSNGTPVDRPGGSSYLVPKKLTRTCPASAWGDSKEAIGPENLISYNQKNISQH